MRRSSPNSALSCTSTKDSVVGWAGLVSVPPSGGGASVTTETPRDAGALGMDKNLTVGGRNSLVLSPVNGTEATATRFTWALFLSRSH
ncbi:hypothetical protein GCM10010393_47290 [Streptomyces gobitricini]|uniref:Uncharacterized protein n=1 Tax=Streptomyces gobitricini TaxID=68211 RepID=A0ABP6A1I3_9ACTN